MLSLRTANQADAVDLLRWRNDPLSRSMSIDNQGIKLRDHLSWLTAKLKTANCMFLVAEAPDAKVGTVRFDINQRQGAAEVSINLNPLMRGRGLGKAVLAESINYFLQVHPVDIKAAVKIENEASSRIFESCDFLHDHVGSKEGFQNYLRPCQGESNLSKNNEIGNTGLLLEMIDGSYHQKSELYRLLANRMHCISHHDLPGVNQHNHFVDQHPYRIWFLVKKDQKYIGSVYLTRENTIGINLETDIYGQKFAEYICVYLISNINPLPELKSVRPSGFVINISPTNQSLLRAIRNIGGNKIQTSYSVTGASKGNEI